MAHPLTNSDRLQYVADSNGVARAVVLPIDVWDAIREEIEGPPDESWLTSELRERIVESMNSPPETRVSWDEALCRLGITQEEVDAAD